MNVDLSGTYIKARDNKRIAVFQGNQSAEVGGSRGGDLLFEQANFTPNVATRARSNFSCLEFAEEWGVCALTTKTFTRYLSNPDSMRFFVAGPEPKKINAGFVYAKRKAPSFYGQASCRDLLETEKTCPCILCWDRSE